MSTFVRASKFRHVFCDPPRPEAIFSNLRLSTTTGEQNYIKCNAKYFAVGLSGGGGPFAVLPLDKPGKLPSDLPMICGHSAAVLDFEFNPFHDQIIASAGEDATIKVWGIPEDGVTTNISEPLVDLAGHSRKISLLRFHPTASNVLASVSSDPTVKLWDVETGAEMSTFSDMADQLCQEIVWDYCGNNFAVSNKDKAVRIVDARSCSIAQKIATAHEGAKSTKLVYLGDSGKLCSVGFTRQSQRQFKIWDPRNLTAEIKKVDIDQAAGVIMPFFDPDTNLLYLAGKGDGNVRFYEFVNENPHCFPISDFRSQTPAKGMAMVPKRGLNVMGCETSRLLKLTSNSVEPLSFSVPRKSDAFQDDLYPPTIAPESCHTAAEWLAGSSLPPKKMSLNPANKGAVVSGGAGSSAPKTFTAPKTAAQLQAELNAANAKLAKYEEKLKAAGISLD